MKRDFDLLRQILLTVENSATGWSASKLAVNGRTGEEVGYHSHLLIESGLARGIDVTNVADSEQQGLITGLTWAGHEFAELVRDDKRWQATIAVLKAQGAAITFDEIRRRLSKPSVPVDMPPGRRLERDVATIYRALGSQVQQDVSLAGNQIDVLVAERTTSGALVRSAIECKAYSKPVGLDAVNQFTSLVRLLQERRLIERA